MDGLWGLDLDMLDELHEKFPIPTFTLPKEPSLVEMTTNFTQAVAGWAKAGFKVVERQVFEERHNICKAYEFGCRLTPSSKPNQPQKSNFLSVVQLSSVSSSHPP